MVLESLDLRLSVCRVRSFTPDMLEGELCFLARTDEELSLVCPEDRVPDGVLDREDGWRALRFQGQLDFSLTGILAPAAALLAEHGISMFAVSTFNTDYILVQESQHKETLRVLAEAGYSIVSRRLRSPE